MKRSYRETSWSNRRPPEGVTGRIAGPGIALVVLLLIFFSAGSARSNAVGTSGDVMIIAPPPSAVRGALEDNKFDKVFAEQSSLVLPSDVAVDVTNTNAVDECADLSPGLVPAGTVIDSYLLHSDIVGYGPIRQFKGTVTFDTEILGVIVQATGLYATDKLLGSSTTKYLPPNVYRGFEGPGFPATADIVRDTLQLSADFRTVTFEFRTGEMLDEARIITRARTNSGVVPEPSTACLAAISLLSVGLWRKP